jgi:type VI secretion system secreted protein VgrG
LDTPFELAAGPCAPGNLRVISFTGREQISSPYAIDVRVFASEGIDDVDASLLGQPARLILHVAASGARSVHGIVEAIEAEGVYLHDRRAYRLRFSPRLRKLKRRRTRRIFQDLTTAQVVSAILGEHDVALRWQIARELPVRAYCVQYDETDYDFVARLLAEEGLFYFFDQPEEAGEQAGDTSETVVFSDTAEAYAPINGGEQLVYRAAQAESGMTPREDHVSRFSLGRRTRSRGALVRAYDFRRPLVDLRDEAPAPPSSVTETLYTPSGELEESGPPPPAAVLLEQEQAGAARARGESFCRRLMPGRRFSLVDHDAAELSRAYVVTRVDHEGYSPEILPAGRAAYQCRFACAPAVVPMRPRAPRRTPRQAMETAVVVGPEGQEIHTDEHGRIKVRFHWDLDGTPDERASCWIRVAQTWAGTGWGAQMIPRVGMEVLVAFLGGDPDRPVVTGCLYNATHPPPFRLPESKTQSGIRTQSSPGGEGFNEILFDDKKGGELLALRAQRDLVTTVLNDRRTEVSGKQTASIARDREATVRGDDRLDVTGSLTTLVRGGASLSVGGSGSSVYAGSRGTAVAGDDVTRIEGGQTVLVTKFSTLMIGQGGDEANATVAVNGSYRLGAAQEIELSAKKRIRLRCGDSVIEIGPSEIKLSSPTLTLRAEKALSCAGNGNALDLGEAVQLKGDAIKLFSKDGSLVMDDDVKIDGRFVKLNCDKKRPPPRKESDGPEELGEITFRVDPQFESDDKAPITLVIATPDGTTIEKEADAAGEVKLQGKKGGHYVLVDVRKGKHSLSKRQS